MALLASLHPLRPPLWMKGVEGSAAFFARERPWKAAR